MAGLVEGFPRAAEIRQACSHNITAARAVSNRSTRFRQPLISLNASTSMHSGCGPLATCGVMKQSPHEGHTTEPLYNDVPDLFPTGAGRKRGGRPPIGKIMCPFASFQRAVPYAGGGYTDVGANRSMTGQRWTPADAPGARNSR
jgi:hypothetical protein